jgi:hypothetical protein
MLSRYGYDRWVNRIKENQKLHIDTDKEMLAMMLQQRRMLSRLETPRSYEHLLSEQSFSAPHVWGTSLFLHANQPTQGKKSKFIFKSLSPSSTDDAHPRHYLCKTLNFLSPVLSNHPHLIAIYEFFSFLGPPETAMDDAERKINIVHRLHARRSFSGPSSAQEIS